jgi:hypothetical protein
MAKPILILKGLISRIAVGEPPAINGNLTQECVADTAGILS